MRDRNTPSVMEPAITAAMVIIADGIGPARMGQQGLR
jgi:hypothetical protein